jgi:hypothetical protein
MLKINRRGRLAAVMLASVLTVGITQTVTIAPAAAASQADRERVQWRALSDGRWEVRQAAAVALNKTPSPSDPDPVATFLRTGLTAAMNRAALFERNNNTTLEVEKRNSRPGSFVHIGCDRALRATHDDKDDFIRFGLEAAREADQEDPQQVEVATQAQADRDYVASLAESDPGPQVKAAAVAAITAGEDQDIADFFSYYWAAGARLDDEAYKLAISDLDLKGNAKMAQLRAAALRAQAAEEGLSGEALEKARAETASAWRAVQVSAAGASVDWTAEAARAAEQSAKWAAVAAYAEGATTEQDWAAVVARARTDATAWQDAVRWAEQQAAAWAQLAEEAGNR